MVLSWWLILGLGAVGGFLNALFLERIVTPYWVKEKGYELYPGFIRSVALGAAAGFVVSAGIAIHVSSASSFYWQILLVFMGGFCFESVFTQIQSNKEARAVNEYLSPL